MLGPLLTTLVDLSAILSLSSFAYRATSLQRPDPSSSIILWETSRSVSGGATAADPATEQKDVENDTSAVAGAGNSSNNMEA